MAAGLAPIGARAGGQGNLVTSDGKPARRDNSKPFTYNLDLGKLGTLSNTKAARLVDRQGQAY